MDFSDIAGYENWKIITKIEEGWSDDEKFLIKTFSGKKLLLRAADIGFEKRRRWEFETLKRLNSLDMNTSEAIDFITSQNKAYTILSWTEGRSLDGFLSSLCLEEQYSLGVAAGKILQKIHTISSPDDLSDWEERFNRKIDKASENYQSCDLRLPHDKKILNFINENRYLVKNRPQTLQHGDYHTGNMIYHDGKISIIDFNRMSYGDPWQEFDRIVWIASESPHFATGYINGYFDDNLPDDFFPLLALYIAVIQIQNLPWAKRFGQSEIDTMMDQVKNVLKWYNNFNTSRPSWYL